MKQAKVLLGMLVRLEKYVVVEVPDDNVGAVDAWTDGKARAFLGKEA